MRFTLVDRIIEVEAGKSLRMVKNLTLGEEYLADHFPTFPVMPGVMMLQTFVEAGAWLLRLTEDYQHSVIVLREVKGVKYGNLMEPGKCMVVTVELSAPLGDDDLGLASFKAKGESEGVPIVSARLTLHRYNLRDKNPALTAHDERIVKHWRSLYPLLRGEMRSCVR